MRPFSTTVRFSDVFKGYRKGALGTDGLSNNHIYILDFAI